MKRKLVLAKALVFALSLFVGNTVSAHKVSIKPLSDTEMNTLDMSQLDKNKTREYIIAFLSGQMQSTATTSKEMQVAATLVGKLTKAQKAKFKLNAATPPEKSACWGSLCTTAQCSELNYGSVWSALGLCVE